MFLGILNNHAGHKYSLKNFLKNIYIYMGSENISGAINIFTDYFLPWTAIA